MKTPKPFKYTPEQVEFLLSYAPGRRVKVITAEYNRTFGTSAGDDSIRAFLERNEVSYLKRGRLPNIQHTSEQIQFLREFAPLCTILEITAKYNETFGRDLSDQVIRDLVIREGIPFKRVCKDRKTKHQYTSEQLRFLAEFSFGHDTLEITTEFNRVFGTSLTRQAMRSFLTSRDFACDKRATSRFTADQRQFLLERYSSSDSEKVTELFNETFGTAKSVKSIRAIASLLGIRSGWRNTKVFGRPVGTEVIESHGYIKVRVPRSEATGVSPYKFKQVYVWEKAHGPVPPGMKVTFKDGDRLNCDQDNLILVSNSELLHLTKNDYKQTPDELKPSVLALSKLQAKMVQRLKILEPTKKRR